MGEGHTTGEREGPCTGFVGQRFAARVVHDVNHDLSAVLVDPQLRGGEAISTRFGDKDLDERRLVSADRVEIVGDTVDVGDVHIDSETSDDSPFRFGRESSERVDQRSDLTTLVAGEDDRFTRHGLSETRC